LSSFSTSSGPPGLASTIGDTVFENDVVIGRDGELYLASGGHHTVDHALGRRPINPDLVDTFAANIARRASVVGTRNAQYLHIIYPDKQSVVTENYLTPIPVRLGAEYIKAVADRDTLLYPLEVLQRAAQRPYLKTDTHLTDYGSILVACSIVERLLSVDVADCQTALISTLTAEREIFGDLGSKLSPPRSSRETFARLSWPTREYFNDLGGGNNGAFCLVLSPKALTDKRLLWFGDSFGRTALKFISYFFPEILFLRTPFMHDEFVEQMQPDFVVSNTVERYLASCQSDIDRPSFFLFPFLGGREAHCSAESAEMVSAVLSYPRVPYSRIKSAAQAIIGRSIGMQQGSVGESKTASAPIVAGAASRIELPAASAEKAKRMGIVPDIHVDDFIFKFVAKKFKDDLSGAIGRYYDLGHHSASLLRETLAEVAAVKKVVNGHDKWAPGRIMDFASGYGGVIRHLGAMFPDSQLSTCDIHSSAVLFNREALGVGAFGSSSVPGILSIPEQDVIFALSFFSHMPASTFGRWIEALSARLAPGGVLIFTANGYVTDTLGTTGVQVGSDGYGFDARSEQGDIDTAEYGITISYPQWVFRLADQIPNIVLFKFRAGQWWAIQDTYVYLKK